MKKPTRRSSTKKSFLSRVLSSKRSKKFVPIVAVLIFAAIGSYLVFFSKAATIPLLTMETEAMTLPAGASIVTDSAASSTKAVLFSTNGESSGQFTMTAPSNQLIIKAKGVQCQGAPQMTIKIDGVQAASVSVSSSGWADYPVTVSASAGSIGTTHKLDIGFTNDYANSNKNPRKRCNRDLYVDKSTFYGFIADPVPPPTTTPPPSTSNVLSWPPPDMSTATTITVNDTTNNRILYLDNTKDYIIKLGTISTLSEKGGLVISGGHNIVMIGGHISIPYAGTSPTVAIRRGLYLERNTGIVHIEGLLIDGPDLSEGIQIGAPNADIRLQNIRMVNVHARDEVGFTDNHPDCIQPWGGARAIRIDRITCSTDAHGMYWDSNDARKLGGPLAYTEVRRYNMIRTVKNAKWVFQRVTADGDQPMVLTEVYVQPEASTSLYDSIGDEPWVNGTYHFIAATISSDGLSASWPQDTSLTGVIKKGPPPGGDFVPDGKAGANYVSPGYQQL